jgi:hypothetical protein
VQVPVALAVGVCMYNTQSGDHLTLEEEGSLLAGFLSFKLAHILYMYQELRPRFKKEAPPPRVITVDPPDQFDLYGNPNAQPRGVQEAERVLAEAEARRSNWWCR